DIGLQLLGFVHRLTTVRSLAADLPVRLCLQKGHETLAYNFVIIGYENSKRCHGSPPWDIPPQGLSSANLPSRAQTALCHLSSSGIGAQQLPNRNLAHKLGNVENSRSEEHT